MPQQVLPAREDFDYLKHELERLGFRQLSSLEIVKQLTHLGAVAPRPRRGREVGFLFFANSLAVTVWTTWLAKESEAREEDTAWVVIVQSGTAEYFSEPVHRTKNFVANLLRRAWVARWRVLHRPLCPGCAQWMSIARGRGVKARYWRCDNRSGHKDGRIVFLGWDHGLPPRAQRYVESLRRRRAKYRAQRRLLGQPTDLALKHRKRWRAKGSE